VTRVLVVGCGAIGSLMAGHLARTGECEVWGYDVALPHVEAIARDGLVVEGARAGGAGAFTARFEIRADPAELPAVDLALVATKSEFTAAAVGAVAHAVRDAAVATVQNGVGNEEEVARIARRVIRGSTLLAGSLPAPGHVRLDAGGETWLGPFEPLPARGDEVVLLAGLLEGGGLRAHALADARPPQWTKLLFNAATNAVGALTGLTIGQVGTAPELRELVAGLLAEGRAVAAALGIELEEQPEDLIDDAVARAYRHRASMLQDVDRRRRTEVDVLNGGIASFGRRAGVPTPLNDAIVGLVRGLERSWDDPAPAA